jgi:hypothetical protein
VGQPVLPKTLQPCIELAKVLMRNSWKCHFLTEFLPDPGICPSYLSKNDSTAVHCAMPCANGDAIDELIQMTPASAFTDAIATSQRQAMLNWKNDMTM